MFPAAVAAFLRATAVSQVSMLSFSVGAGIGRARADHHCLRCVWAECDRGGLIYPFTRKSQVDAVVPGHHAGHHAEAS